MNDYMMTSDRGRQQTDDELYESVADDLQRISELRSAVRSLTVRFSGDEYDQFNTIARKLYRSKADIVREYIRHLIKQTQGTSLGGNDAQ